MQEVGELPSSSEEVLEQEVMHSLGDPEDASLTSGSHEESPHEDMPDYAKARIGKLQKRHQRDMRRMQQTIDQLSSNMAAQQQPMQPSYSEPSYGQEMPMGDSTIHQAVTMALQHRDREEQKAKDREQLQFVHHQYQKLQDDLDKTSDKYDDFEDVVRANHVPITPAMREAALLLDNPGEVLYKLGKNPDELRRIAKLHPLEQAKEMNRLSFALMGGNNTTQPQARVMGQVKNNPISSRSVNERTSVSDLRARMKAGWK